MEILHIVAVAIITLSLTLLLKKEKGEIAFAVGIAGGIVILLMLAEPLLQLLPQLEGLLGKYDSAQVLGPVIKTVIIAYATEFGAEACREGGETFLAGKVELAGKIFMTLTALPFVISLAERLVQIIEDCL